MLPQPVQQRPKPGGQLRPTRRQGWYAPSRDCTVFRGNYWIETSGCFIGSTSFCVPAADFFLLGILNSWLSWYVISKTAQPLRLRAGRWQYRCKRQYMELLPVPAADKDSRESIAALARDISK